jgi:CPA2 family monovalent cation:H+ antiporter-2
MHLPPLISDLATILGVAALVSVVFRQIRQPVILGYIFAGVIVGPHTPPIFSVTDLPGIEAWAQLGVIFLLFDLGLHFRLKKLGAVVTRSGMGGLFETTVMLCLGYILARLLGWPTIEALFLGCMIAVSSTSIVLKSMEEQGLAGTRASENVLGILLIEDLVAMLMLAALTTAAVGGAPSFTTVLLDASKLGLVIGAWLLLGLFFVPRYLKAVKRHGNEETLIVVSLGLCLMLVTLATKLQYSAALGAFMMGSIISEAPVSSRVEQIMRPVRDLFGAVFFVSVGMLADPRVIASEGALILGLALLVIFGKAFAVGLGSLASGQRVSDALRSGLSLGQVGEFSFVIASLGLSMGAISPRLYPVIVAVSVVTTFTTPYMMRLSRHLEPNLERAIPAPWRLRLERFSRLGQYTNPVSLDRPTLTRALRWAANLLAVILIFRLSSLFLRPALRETGPSELFASSLSWALAMVGSSPFLWGMLGSFSPREELPPGARLKRPQQLAWALLDASLAAVLVIALSVGFFPRFWAAIVCLGISLAFFVLFYRRLGNVYRWVERRYVSELGSSDGLPPLVPWEGRLTRLTAHPNSPGVGRSLRDLALREKWNIFVVAIERGETVLAPPSAAELVMPHDVLLVVGEDIDLDRARFLVERSSTQIESAPNMDAYILTPLVLPALSPLANTLLRETGIKERHGASVIGIERQGKRLLNPPSDIQLMASDLLWIVVERERVIALERYLETGDKGNVEGVLA